MKKILMLLGFLIAGLTAFNCQGAFDPSEKQVQEQAQRNAEIIEAELEWAKDKSDEDINCRIETFKSQIRRMKKISDLSLKSQMLTRKSALSRYLAGRKDAQGTKQKEQEEVTAKSAEIRDYVNAEPLFKALAYRDLDVSTKNFQELNAMGAFRCIKVKTDLVRPGILNFLREEKENLNSKILEDLFAKIKLLKPKEKEILEEKKEDLSSKTKKAEKAALAEEKEEKKEEATSKAAAMDQADLLPVLRTSQVEKWQEGSLQDDQESAKLLSQIILDLQNGRNSGTMIRGYSPHFFDIHIGKRQRLYFAYEPVNGKRTLLLLYGGPKTDQSADLQAAHAWHMRFLAESGKKKK